MSTIALIALCVFGPQTMDAKSARAFLRENGLTRSGLVYILEGERELKSGLRELIQLKKRLNQAAQKRDEWRRWIAAKRWERTSGIAELERLSHVLARADDVDDHNEVVMRINTVRTQLSVLSKHIDDAERNEQIPGEMALARATFQSKIAELQEIVRQVEVESERLAEDPEIVSAIKAANADSKKEYSVEPSKRFRRNVERLQKYEDVVLHDRIDLRPNNGTYLIDTVINGKYPKTMILDTGASSVLLSESAARSAGVKFNARTRKVFAKVADGRTIEGRRVILDSVSVGRFTISNVECAVLPDGKSRVDALLGGAFLDHFTYTVDPDANVLTLTRDNVESPRKSKKSR